MGFLLQNIRTLKEGCREGRELEECGDEIVKCNIMRAKCARFKRNGFLLSVVGECR
jgi:hypothetical protein